MAERIAAQAIANLEVDDMSVSVVIAALDAEIAKRAADIIEDHWMRCMKAEARVAELEHDIEVDDWHAAFVRENERAAGLLESNREQAETIAVLRAEVAQAWRTIEEIRTALGAYSEHDALQAAKRTAAMLRDADAIIEDQRSTIQDLTL